MDPALLPFFRPAGIAVVGASSDPTKLGHGVARNLSASGFAGAVHFVNPNGGELLGRPVRRSLADVPDPVDLAVLLVPPRAVADTVRACAARGVRTVIVGSGGFRETGAAGAALEAEVAATARGLGVRLMGPNCVGVLDTHVPFDTTFLAPPLPAAGGVAFLSQSGALCAAVIGWAGAMGLGLSRLVSLGNEADVGMAELLPAVAEDPHTRAIALYLEGAGGRRLVDAVREVAAATPVVALKAGRRAGGRRAASSHTGALAGDDAVFDAACRAAGMVRALTAQDLLDAAAALAWCPPIAGRRVAVLTNAGGPGVLAVDALEARGLTLADLAEATRAALARLLPAAASTANPVDMLAGAGPDQFASCLSILLDDAAVDAALVVLPPPPTWPAEDIAERVARVAGTARKPVTVALCGGPSLAAAAARLAAATVPAFPTPERAAAALAVLCERRDALAARVVGAGPPPAIDVAAVRRVLAEGDATAIGATRLAAAAGIAVAPLALARTAGEAGAIAARLGGAVALKVVAADLSHKTDVGGVALDVAPAAAGERFTGLMAAVKAARPGAEPAGVAVQPMAPAGADLIVGIARDPDYGPLVMVGGGGTGVETDRDVAFLLLPATRGDVSQALDATRAGRLLRAARGGALDRDAVVDTVLRVAALATALPEIAELDINPLRVFAAGRGVLALDVRVRVS